LRIGIDYEDAKVVSGQSGGDINGGGGFSDTALLIRDGENPAPAVMLARMIEAEQKLTSFHVKHGGKPQVPRETSPYGTEFSPIQR
jgi:hypothetical protein